MPFRSFDSIEEALEFIREQEELANAEVNPIQKRVTRGSYALRPAPEINGFIFGYVFTEDEVRAGEIGAGSDPDELEFTMQHLANSYERGYRFGRWHSVVVPEGELGDAHVTNLFPIRKEDFELAQRMKWNMSFSEASQIMLLNLRDIAREN